MDNMRALLVGGGAAEAARLAVRLAPGAMVICFAPDRAAADAISRAFASRAPDARVSVMIGDPALLVHKVAGPFDVIVDAHGTAAAPRARLRQLLRENGELDG
ncbi:MAG TPA: hypothetical protein VK886_13265 [Vicinamibacterales bacterium]|nr:hypothetical protein [Vicinamibacterales bacterium]